MFFHPKRGGSGIVRFMFFGADNNLLLLDTISNGNFLDDSVTLIDFTTTPPSEKRIFLATRRTTTPPPRVQFSAGAGKVFLIFSSDGTQILNLAIYRSDNGALLCGGIPGFIPTGEIQGKATATDLIISFSSSNVRQEKPCPIPSGVLSVSPASATFPEVVIGGSPSFTSQTFTPSNSGNDCLTISAIGNRFPFRVMGISRTLPATLQAGQSMTVTVTFAPSAPGTYSEELPITRTPERPEPGATGLVCRGTARQASPPLPPPLPPRPPASNVFNIPPCDVDALISAINRANSTSVADTIILGTDSCTYTLRKPSVTDHTATAFGLPVITTPITIRADGNGVATIKRDTGSSAFGIFVVESTGTLALRGLTVTGGQSLFIGGGIINSGTLMLTDSTISGNTARAGGGIINLGTLTITNSTISGNLARNRGGGIFNASLRPLTITNSTISDNIVVRADGGDGGGIYNGGTLLEITNVTMNNNTAAIGGGIRNDTNAMLKNTIIANSPSGGNCFGTITSNGNNLDSGETCGFTGTGDLTNTDPLLGALADNGGPTLTHALVVGSPAVDAVASGCPPPHTDQRGLGRPVDGDGDGAAACDIGAFELD